MASSDADIVTMEPPVTNAGTGKRSNAGRHGGAHWEYFEKVSDTSDQNYRWDVKCRLCSEKFVSARAEEMRNHVMICSKATPQIVAAFTDSRAKEHSKKHCTDSLRLHGATKAQAAKTLKQRTLDSNVQQHRKLLESTIAAANTKLVMLTASGNLPFRTLDKPAFYEFCHLLNPSYNPPGSYVLRNTLLPDVYHDLRKADTRKMEEARYITLAADFWTNAAHQGVFGCVAMLDDRSTVLLAAEDVSDASHTAEYIKGREQGRGLACLRRVSVSVNSLPQPPPCRPALLTPLSMPPLYRDVLAGKLQACIDQAGVGDGGKKKVVAIVTDNASAPKLARNLLKLETEYKHVLEFRCHARMRAACIAAHACACTAGGAGHACARSARIAASPRSCPTAPPCRCSMHSFALFVNDLLAHEYAKGTVADAQRIVTYFLASAQPLAELRRLIDAYSIKGGGLQSSNKTRFTSVHQVRRRGSAMAQLHYMSLRSHCHATHSQRLHHAPPTHPQPANVRADAGECQAVRASAALHGGGAALPHQEHCCPGHHQAPRLLRAGGGAV